MEMEKKLITRTNIDWCINPDGSKGYVWNPAWGCLTGCKYCFARDIARRFGKKVALKEHKWWKENHSLDNYLEETEILLTGFKPVWIESNFNRKFPKKPSRIFVNSMSDIQYWEQGWVLKVIEKIKEYPYHTFIFLTKSPEIYYKYEFEANCFLGATATTENEICTYTDTLGMMPNVTFISIEPIQEKIHERFLDRYKIDWLIIGAETGNRKNKIIPEKSWIEEFRNIDIPVFMKDNLRDIIGDNLRQEFPE